MKVKLAEIKKLRQSTGAGIMDCRKALEESKGDLKKAREWLKKKGIEKAAKKKGRETPQGLVECYLHNKGKIGAMIEVACETDFVAQSPLFKNLCHELAMQVAAMNPKTKEELLKQVYIKETTMTVEDLLKQMIGRLGENIIIRQFVRFEINA